MLNILLLSAASAATAAATTTAVTHDPEDDTIVVSASPLERSSDQLIHPVSVLTGEELQRQLRNNLGETLAREPGVSSTYFGAGASRPIIRGLDGDRIRTLTNGIGTIDAAAASPDHATPIDPVLAETIEVVRGTGLLRYGSSAAGGVVNVDDGRIPSEVPENGFEGAARAALTTVDEGSEFSAGGSALLGKVGGLDVVLTAQGSLRSAGDFDIPGFAESARLRALEEEEEHEEEEHGHEEEEEVRDTLENSFLDYQSFAGGLSFIGERGFFGFSVQDTRSEYGLPGHSHGHGHEEEHEGEGHEEEEEGAFIDLEQTRFDVNASLNLDTFIQRVDVFAGFADYAHTEFEAPGEAGTVFSNEGYEIRTELVQQQRGNWRGASGVQYTSSEFSAIGEEAFIDPNTSKQWGFYSFQELTFGDLVTEASWRFEDTEVKDDVEGIERGFQGFSWALGANYALAEDSRATLNVFRTVRAPTAIELFADGPHLATETFEIGNANLDEEIAVGIEAGIRFGGEGASIGINAFHTDYDNFIYQAFTGETGADILMALGEDDEEELEEFGELAVVNFTGADATFTGFEVFGDAEFGSALGLAWSGDFVLDYVDARLDDGGRLPRIPPLGVVVGLDAEMERARFRAEVDHAAGADGAAFQLDTDSFTLVNLYADINVTERVTFQVSALNLTDEEARVHTSFLKDQLPLPGRNFRFALRVAM